MAARYEDYKRDYESFLREQRGGKRPRRSVCLLLATLLGLAYGAYLIYHFGGGVAGAQSDGEALGRAFAAYLVGPHVLLSCAGALCGLAGWLARNRWLALVAGILYLVAGLAFPMYFLFAVLQGILSIVAFALMGRARQSGGSVSGGGKQSRAPVIVGTVFATLAVVLAVLVGIGWYTQGEGAAPAGAEEAASTVPIELTPGEYTVGAHIPAGRYLITTEEELCIVTSDRFLHTLHKGDDGYTCDLEDGNYLDCTDSITLTPTD